MKATKYENREDWLDARRGKITGTRLKDVITLRGTGKKIGFYELIAERLAIPATDESAMERGQSLEPEAMEKFVEETGKKVDTSLVLWTSDENENIAISPDGFIGEKEAVEVKCLSSARHIEAFLTQEVPSDYEFQVLQYFIVNEKLETLYLAFYDPRLTVKDFFFLTVKRDQEKVDKYLAHEKEVLAEVSDIVASLSF